MLSQVPQLASALADRTRVIFIIGPTGSGKSRLGIDIAAACNGEVINADAIQMYAGLDVASAKLPPAARRCVPHHLLSFLPPRSQVTVRDFNRLASAVIADVAGRGRLPVVVGGTLYYVQALLRESLLEDDEAAARAARADGGVDCGGGRAASDSLSLHARLAQVDPVMAQRLHPADTRKLERALAVFDATGLPYSEVLARQAARLAGTAGRFDARTYWLSVDDRAAHNARLDARVVAMMGEGLPAEIRALRAELRGGAPSPPQPPQPRDEPSELTRRVAAGLAAGAGGSDGEPEGGSFSGLLQAIGYKEFEEYLALCDAHPAAAAALDAGAGAAAGAPAAPPPGAPAAASAPRKRPRAPPPSPEEALTSALARGAARLREVTHGYARKQERWIRNRFEARGVPLVKVDTSSLGGGGGGWEAAVGAPVVADVHAWLAGAPAAQLLPPSAPAALATDAAAVPPAPDIDRIRAWRQVVCEPCGGRVINGGDAWLAHEASKGHKRALARAAAPLRRGNAGEGAGAPPPPPPPPPPSPPPAASGE